jgi:hypothetical protein
MLYPIELRGRSLQTLPPIPKTKHPINRTADEMATEVRFAVGIQCTKTGMADRLGFLVHMVLHFFDETLGANAESGTVKMLSSSGG